MPSYAEEKGSPYDNSCKESFFASLLRSTFTDENMLQ